MTSFKKYLVLGATITGLASATAGYAQSQQAFMVIRFNQQRVYFDQQLYNAVSKAVSLKEDVMFEVISYVPATGDAAKDAEWRKTAEHNLGVVVARMNSIGVPSSRLTTSIQSQQSLRYDEVHLFAN